MGTNASLALTKTGRMIWISGGSFTMGSDHYYPEESPSHRVSVGGFWIDEMPVTNAEFSRFLEATDYVTVAERPANPADYPGAKSELLVPASVVFVKPRRRVDMRNAYNWWRYVQGADWRHPLGPKSSVEGLENHPVVHVAYADVEAYCAWAGKELPTEAEWEFAARGGLEGTDYAWGDEFMPDSQQMANTWHGEFPHQKRSPGGFERTSAVKAFPPNGYGLYDMIGNVWEWTADWYSPKHQADAAKACCIPENPRGGSEAGSLDPRQPTIKIPCKVLKGGSHLCAPNYCRRYRPAARHAQPVDTSTSHVGFR